MQKLYETPYMEIIRVASERGFSNSSEAEEVGKDEYVEF